jgi:hypothetical protein
MKRIFLIPVLVLSLCGLSLASNMGFKLNYTLKKTAGTTATNWVSLPFFWSGANAQAVCTDIGAAATQIGRYDETTDTFVSWVCGNVGTPFTLTSGEAIFVKVTTDNTSWVIVGSHNDSASVTLKKTAGTTATNWVSTPYHTTATNAQGICTQIANATQIGRYDETTDTFVSWVCGNVGTPFTLTPGEGIFIKVTTDGTVWTPAHY